MILAPALFGVGTVWCCDSQIDLAYMQLFFEPGGAAKVAAPIKTFSLRLNVRIQSYAG